MFLISRFCKKASPLKAVIEIFYFILFFFNIKKTTQPFLPEESVGARCSWKQRDQLQSVAVAVAVAVAVLVVEARVNAVL
jgi:hypothetical protein